MEPTEDERLYNRTGRTANMHRINANLARGLFLYLILFLFLAAATLTAGLLALNSIDKHGPGRISITTLSVVGSMWAYLAILIYRA